MSARIYISGRITDYPGHDDHFMAAESRLRGAGYETVNPLTISHKPDATYEDYMRADVAALVECDEIYMLHGWERSAGARCEHLVAAMCGLTISYEPEVAVGARGGV